MVERVGTSCEEAIGEWLRSIGLGRYARAFAENDVDFSVLASLTEADLKELSVASLGHRKRLLAAIRELTAANAPSVPKAAALPSERRQVTVLFADLCGFTAMSRSLDPEEVRELVARFTTQVDGIVVGTEERSTSTSATRSWPCSARRAPTMTIRCARRVQRWTSMRLSREQATSQSED
ncbi:MAG: hypothetical protein ACJ8F3_00745 [Xanthobacteraceae bacterium]